jgi:hypothetical protein
MTVIDFDDPKSHPYDSDGDATTPCQWCEHPLDDHDRASMTWVSEQQWRVMDRARSDVAQELGVDESEVF